MPRNNTTPFRRRRRRPIEAVQPVPGRLALTVPEAAWELNCHPNHVANLIRTRLVARSAIEELIARGGTGAQRERRQGGWEAHLMARARLIRPEWIDRPERRHHGYFVQLLSILVMMAADDYGRLVDSPRNLAGHLFPLEDDVTAEMVRDGLDQLAKVGRIDRYEVDGVGYIVVNRWMD
jgi:hypothetical protein